MNPISILLIVGIILFVLYVIEAFTHNDDNYPR